jgi:RNA recognition motif-containing protein
MSQRDSHMNIYVGNLSLELTEDELRQEFSVFGQVESVTIMNDRDIGSGQPCGYGFVEMTLKSEGITAVTSLRGKTIKGRIIEVVESLCFSGRTERESLDTRRGNRFNRIKQRSIRSKFHRLP